MEEEESILSILTWFELDKKSSYGVDRIIEILLNYVDVLKYYNKNKFKAA